MPTGIPGGGGILRYFHFEFQYFWGFSERRIYFWGYEEILDIFFDHYVIGLFFLGGGGVIHIHLGLFLKDKIQSWNNIWGSQYFKYFWVYF